MAGSQLLQMVEQTIFSASIFGLLIPSQRQKSVCFIVVFFATINYSYSSHR